MLVKLLEYFWLGFVITALPGAVFFEVLRRNISSKSTVKNFLYGNFTGMSIIIALAFFGLAFVNNVAVTKVFYFISALVLLFIGVSALFQIPKNLKPVDSRNSAFTTGLILATANPVSIAFWVSLMGRFEEETQNLLGPIILSLAVLSGALSVFLLLIIATNRLPFKIIDEHLKFMSIVFGLILIVFGLFSLGKTFS